MPANLMPGSKALENARQHNVLTCNGVPFHAVLQLSEEKGDAAYKGSVELFWAGEKRYRLVLTSPAFSQTLIVDGERVSEVNKGDFYPGWLQNFATALLDPMPRYDSLVTVNTKVMAGEHAYSCVNRNDKVNGITNDLTWASVCFRGEDTDLTFVNDFSYNMEFNDLKKFEGKRIARTYVMGAGDHARIDGKMTTLERWTPDPKVLAVSEVTPAAERIRSTLVSTLKEESMVERAPQNVEWPKPHEGKTEGYMIVYARTDRTGQVRETSKHNSDNPGLESFGRLVALRYKFHPLIVDGVVQQMEMPLVLHFTTALGKPIPELDDATSRKLISGCALREVDDPKAVGKPVVIQFQVNEEGKLMTLGAVDHSLFIPALITRFHSCSFGVYTEDGKPSAYHANVTMMRK